MKKFSSYKGFTLVELMIVIAIIGILAAVLYPSLTGYLERTRDTNRQTAIKKVASSLGVYYTDNNSYPAGGNAKCLDDISSQLKPTAADSISYIDVIPKDPKPNAGLEGCTGNGKTGYGYMSLKYNGSTPPAGKAYAFLTAAAMEIRTNGNMLENDYIAIKTNNTAKTTADAQNAMKEKSALTAVPSGVKKTSVFAMTAQ